MEKEFPIWYCPICGMDNQLYSNTKCEWCDNSITMVKSKHSHTYYTEKAKNVYSKELYNLTDEEKHSILIDEEACHNPLFNRKLAEKSFKKWHKQAKQANDQYFEKINQAKGIENIPKCPTCQSTNIKKISTASKVVGGAFFGLFSKNVRSQFECVNCGYKW